MIGLLKALGLVKSVAAVAVLTTATAFAAQAALPTVSDPGQAHAAAAAANANQHAVTPDLPDPANAASGKDVAAIQTRLAANKARLLEKLEAVLARLEANPKVNAHATDALKKVIERITNGDTGLNRATNAIDSQGGPDTPGQPTLPSQAQNHPGPGNPPSHP